VSAAFFSWLQSTSSEDSLNGEIVLILRPTPERNHIRRCSDTLFIATRPSIKYHIHAAFTLVLTLSDARRIRVQYR
jgi:hypothetical protein